MNINSHDDFLVPQSVDLSTKCNAESTIIYSSTIFPVGAILSLMCYMYLMWMYFIVKTPVLKRHPTSKSISKPKPCLHLVIFSSRHIQVYVRYCVRAAVSMAALHGRELLLRRRPRRAQLLLQCLRSRGIYTSLF